MFLGSRAKAIYDSTNEPKGPKNEWKSLSPLTQISPLAHFFLAWRFSELQADLFPSHPIPSLLVLVPPTVLHYLHTYTHTNINPQPGVVSSSSGSMFKETLRLPCKHEKHSSTNKVLLGQLWNAEVSTGGKKNPQLGKCPDQSIKESLIYILSFELKWLIFHVLYPIKLKSKTLLALIKWLKSSWILRNLLWNKWPNKLYFVYNNYLTKMFQKTHYIFLAVPWIFKTKFKSLGCIKGEELLYKRQ